MRLCWLVLAGCGRIGFDPAGTPLPDAPLADGLPTFTGPQPDPTMLPLATGQLEQPVAPGATLTAGESYLDPITGVRIWRLSDATFPEANSAGRTDQELAGAVASAAWNGNHHTIEMFADDTRWLVDLERGVGVSNPRKIMFGLEDSFAFSTDPAAPRIAFAIDSNHELHRLDTETVTVIDGAPFPIAGFDSFVSVSAGARTISGARVGNGMIALDVGTGRVFEQAGSGSTIPVADLQGLYMTERATSGASDLWHIGAAATSSWKPPTGDFGVSAGVVGGFVALDNDTGNGMKLYFAQPSNATFTQISDYEGYDALRLATQWVQTAVPFREQWILTSSAEAGFPPPTRLDDAIGFWNLSGELRLLAHHYGPDDPTFYLEPRASSSPDGRIVVFTSTMGTARSDVWAIEVPLLP